MALYEHTFIARQDISIAQAEALLEHFRTILTDNGGKIIDTEYWGLKTLAYKINKNRKGHYCFFRSDSPADAVHEMERLMRLHEDVMRNLTIKVEEHTEGPTIMMQAKTMREDRDRARSERGEGEAGDDDAPRKPRRDKDGDSDKGDSRDSQKSDSQKSDSQDDKPADKTDKADMDAPKPDAPKTPKPKTPKSKTDDAKDAPEDTPASDETQTKPPQKQEHNP